MGQAILISSSGLAEPGVDFCPVFPCFFELDLLAGDLGAEAFVFRSEIGNDLIRRHASLVEMVPPVLR
jgi:hypothetical protein